MKLSQRASDYLSGDWWLAPFTVGTFFAATQVVMALNIGTAFNTFNNWLGVPYGCFSNIWINIQQWTVFGLEITLFFIIVASIWMAIIAICLFTPHLLHAIPKHIKKLLITSPTPVTTIVQP